MREIICVLCGSSHYREVRRFPGAPGGMPEAYRITFSWEKEKPSRLLQCYRCGLVFCDPLIPEEEVNRLYSRLQDEEYEREKEARLATAARLVEMIGRYVSGRRMLDIGCATGLLLSEARKRAWEVNGVELSSWGVDLARQRIGAEHVFQGAVEDAGFAYNRFDAVVLIDVLEHLPQPLRTLEELRRIQKPDGILCVSTPDIDSLASRLLGARWWGIQLAHRYYFSRRTLGALLEAAGFRVVKTAGYPRFFSSRYISARLAGYNTRLKLIFDLLMHMSLSSHRRIRIDFGDQILVFARKKRTLAHIRDDEKNPPLTDGSVGTQKTIVVLPAYNAARTLEVTVRDIPRVLVDEIILVDDGSTDETVKVAQSLGLTVVRHEKNRGYGANQKTCYTEALERGADIVVMVHPDYQYDPQVIPELIRPIRENRADAVFGSRMMKGGALEGGMPLWKHNANILLTAFENVVLGTYLTEYHSGFRAYSAAYLRGVKFLKNSDGFLFDTEIIVQGLFHRFRFEEVPIHTRYFDEASTIRFIPSVLYGLGIAKTMAKCILHKSGIFRFHQFE